MALDHDRTPRGSTAPVPAVTAHRGRRPPRPVAAATAVLVAAGAVLVVAMAGVAAAGDPYLDPSFGVGGLVRAPRTAGVATDLAVDSADRKILAGSTGTAPGDIRVARYTPLGQRDTSFSGDGLFTAAVSPEDDFAADVAVASDDGLVVVGGTRRTGQTIGYDILLLRLTPTGELDESFGRHGVVVTSVGVDAAARAVAIDADGRLLVAGWVCPETTTHCPFTVARYHPDGRLDVGFGRRGFARAPTTDGSVHALAVTPDGAVVAGGVSCESPDQCNMTAARFTADGALDTTFSGDGIVEAVAGPGQYGIAFAVAVQPDGKVVLAGRQDDAWPAAGMTRTVVVRYGTDGGLDTGFGVNGRVVVDLPGHDDTATAIALQENGRIAVGAIARTVQRRGVDFAVVRLTREGALDLTFGANGVAYATFGDDDDVLSGLVVDRTGRIVAGGTTYPSSPGPGSFAMAAFLP